MRVHCARKHMYGRFKCLICKFVGRFPTQGSHPEFRKDEKLKTLLTCQVDEVPDQKGRKFRTEYSQFCVTRLPELSLGRLAEER